MNRYAAWLLVALAAMVAPASGFAQMPPDNPAASQTRLIQVSQLGPNGAVIGEPNQVACPSSGCQTIINLTVATLPEPFLFSVEFVAKGAYVTLAPRSIATSAVLDFEERHQGAIFVALRSNGRQQLDMSFIVVRSRTVRALEPDAHGDVLASGDVFNSKRKPDLVLRVSFAPPGG